MPILDDKSNENNIVLQASLVNLSSLIQKILDENKRNQERDLSDFYSSNNIILKESSSELTKKSKNIEVNKKINDLQKSNNRQLNTSPNKSVNERNFVSNIHINTLANIKGLMTNNNFHNYVGNAVEKTQSSVTQDEKNSKSNEQSEYIEDSNKIKNKKTKNIMNKTQNSFDYRKNIYNINDNKSEKNIHNKNNKTAISLKKLKSNKLTKDRNNSKKNISHKDILDNIPSPEESKIKDENKDSFINKNKFYGANNVNTNSNPNNRKSYQYLNINSANNNVFTKNKNNSKNNHKKSLTHYGTKTELKNKQNNNTNIINTDDVIQKLSQKEKSYYILSKSPILRLKERLFFGRSTNNLRNIQKVSDILKNNEIFLKDKIKELENKIIECDKRINSEFNASKTAEINFNFILSKDEEEFKKFSWLAENEKEKNEYYSYIKIMYLLFNEKYENIELKNLNEKLYNLINKKGFKTIKEYLYHIYFQKKVKNNIIFNIDKINAIFEESKIDKNFNIKFCRFALFTSFLVREIVKYGNEIKNMIELKIKTKELIDVINNKLKLCKEAYSFKKK